MNDTLANLLGRPEVQFDLGPLKQFVSGKRILITGAGGSIGSALATMIGQHQPAQLTLLDHSEYNLFALDRELARLAPDAPRQEALCDIRDPAGLNHWFERAAPDLVIHAAALKHVAMGERHIVEYVRTNVIGTRLVADLSLRHKVSAMVHISTDKVVNPHGVMGATKRLAESYCQAMDVQNLATRFIAVRFGNILGSAGSVMPLFERQIGLGGPVTVTHPQATRYFMTPKEATVLVLQASMLGCGTAVPRGCVFVLDMGVPVRIDELARRMIRQASCNSSGGIEIQYVGLKEGEKLVEELVDLRDETIVAADKGISRIFFAAPALPALAEVIDDLARAASAFDADRTLAILERAVPHLKQNRRG